MTIHTLQLLFDFGLVVLIFLVQLCIYPAFKYFKDENLVRWHHVYTPNITYVVFPLMMGQLILSSYQTYIAFSLTASIHLGLVILTWLSTFLFFVPLHQKINSSTFKSKDIVQLEKGNWFRLILWLLVFMITLIKWVMN